MTYRYRIYKDGLSYYIQKRFKFLFIPYWLTLMGYYDSAEVAQDMVERYRNQDTTRQLIKYL